MSVAVIILAAGESRRLGRPKQDIVLGKETLLERAVRIAMETGLLPVIAVVRETRLVDALQQSGAIALLNHKAHEGMASSIRCGVEWVKQKQVDGAVLMTCDQPGVRAEHLKALAADHAVMTGSEYGGQIGVPAYFPASEFPSLLALEGDTGARALLRGARSIPQKNLIVDIDTEEDFRAAQILFEK